ncbi:MAG: GNAT family N-acetyltransferase, partial [Actinobacteria bacterium]|nr:GNAT family N-acetyltransferase [Actinomycetota bacterium]
TDSAVSFEFEPPGADVFATRIERGQLHYPWLVAEDDGEVVGYGNASGLRSRPAYQWSAEVSIYLDERHRGNGLGRALLDALLVELEARGIRTVIAGLTLPNPASEALFTAAGFELSGTFRNVGFKFGEWHDVRFLQRSIGGGGPTDRLRSGRATLPGPLGARELRVKKDASARQSLAASE